MASVMAYGCVVYLVLRTESTVCSVCCSQDENRSFASANDSSLVVVVGTTSLVTVRNTLSSQMSSMDVYYTDSQERLTKGGNRLSRIVYGEEIQCKVP